MQIALGIGAALLLIAANALFVAAEFALVACDRNRIERLAKEGSRTAQATVRLLRRLSFHLSGAQLGITITSLILGFVAEPTIARALRPAVDAVGFVPPGATVGVSLGLALALATGTQMVFGELVPKGLAIARPVRASLVLAAPIRIYGIIFGPIITFLDTAADRSVRLLGITPTQELRSVRSLEEFELLIQSSGAEGTLDPDAVTILTRSLRLTGKTASDVLTPRGDVVALPQEARLDELLRVARETGYSRFPVYGRDIDDVTGVAHVKDILRISPAERGDTAVSAITDEAPVVPQSRDVTSLLLEMRGIGKQLAIVVDEYGSVAGILTLEDLLEEIVGEIEDEYDPEGQAARAPAPGTYDLDGRLRADEVAELTGFEMPPGDYKTLAGFLLTRFGRIPVAGDRTAADGWTFEVLELDYHRIARVRAVAPPPPPETEDA